MKILIHTQYFPPEVGAPQNRLYELAIRLREKGAEVTILTAMPNYPEMKIQKPYQGIFRYCEEMNGLKVYRSWIFVTKKRAVLPRLLNYFSFAWTSFWSGLFRLSKYDFIICESPPLFLGMSSFLLCQFKNARLIFNVSDLWPESAEKLGIVTNKFILGLAKRLETFLLNNSYLITGQTQGIIKNISKRFPHKETYWLPNGTDPELFDPGKINSDWRKENNFSQNDFLLLYAGIIGHAQGLEVILKAAEILRENSEIKFILVGTGPEKDKLISLRHQKNLNNVFFFDVVPKNRIMEIIKDIDCAIIPLKKLKLFQSAVPSKIFESIAMKKAVLLGVEGESKELFVDEGKCAISFEPENERDLSNKILKVYHNKPLLRQLGENGRSYVIRKFNRHTIADEFWNRLINSKK